MDTDILFVATFASAAIASDDILMEEEFLPKGQYLSIVAFAFIFKTQISEIPEAKH